MNEFSKFTAAGISKNKETVSVVKVVLYEWCLRGLGYPTISYFDDNGNQFEHNFLKDIAGRLGIRVDRRPVKVHGQMVAVNKDKAQ